MIDEWKRDRRPRRYVAYGYGFSGDYDTIDECVPINELCVKSDPDWPQAIYVRIDDPEFARIIGNLRMASADLDTGTRKMILTKNGHGDLGNAAGMLDATIRRLVNVLQHPEPPELGSFSCPECGERWRQRPVPMPDDDISCPKCAYRDEARHFWPDSPPAPPPAPTPTEEGR